MSTQTNPWGDFHDPNDTSGTHGQLDGLIDIAHESNNVYVRSPVPGNAQDLPAGTTPAFGRLANVPDPNNAQYYPDDNLTPLVVNDPATNQNNIAIYPFDTANPLAGTPTAENAMGYLMRYAQWMIQFIGVDGFRIDPVKNIDPWVLNYIDRAVFRASPRTLLNGSQEPIFSFSEVYDSKPSVLQQYYRKDINPNVPNTVGGNRDVLDYPLYFAMQQNFSNNGLQNDWNHVVNASVDAADDGLANNGSEGVAFVSNADTGPPYLDNLAYAYTLMRPGNAIVYFNAQQFGTGRSFPRTGRGDALGGLYGSLITDLVNIRDTHPYGNYTPRDLEKEVLIFERADSLIFAGNNRLDSGYDSRTVQTDFPPGTPLVELTGNAASTFDDPDGVIPQVVVVNSDGTVNLRVPRNVNDQGVEDDQGYVIYGPAGPQGTLSISGVDHVIPGGTPTAATNGTTTLSSINVVTGNTITVDMETTPVTLPGNVRDQAADGDNALIKVDGGVAIDGDPLFTQPGSVVYGYEPFTGTSNPGFGSADGKGHYLQTIDVSSWSDGLHYIDVRVFRHRNSTEPPIFTDFRQAIYINHQKPAVRLQSMVPIVAGVPDNQVLTFRSTDLTPNSVHVFLDLPSGLSDAQILAMLGNANQANQVDRNLFTIDVNGLTSGNHVATVVS
jgi:hypothetical protein